MPSGGTLVTQALKDLAVLSAGQDPGSADLDDGLEVLNGLIDSLGLDRLTLYASVRTTKTLTASTATYTIGSGASINLERPAWIEAAALIPDTAASPTTEREIDVLTDDQYAAYTPKAGTGTPSAVWYDRSLDASGYGLIYPLPVPSVSTVALVLYTPGGHLAAFDSGTDVILPRGYGWMLRKQLALALSVMYPAAVVSPLLLRQASAALSAVRSANWRIPQRANDDVLLSHRGGFNIETGR